MLALEALEHLPSQKSARIRREIAMLTREQIEAALTRLTTGMLRVSRYHGPGVRGRMMQQKDPVTLLELARSALACEGVRTRYLAQSFLRQTPYLARVTQPQEAEADELAVAAALLELFSDRRGEPSHRG